jgi:hypothetical protein
MDLEIRPFDSITVDGEEFVGYSHPDARTCGTHLPGCSRYEIADGMLFLVDCQSEYYQEVIRLNQGRAPALWFTGTLSLAPRRQADSFYILHTVLEFDNGRMCGTPQPEGLLLDVAKTAVKH